MKKTTESGFWTRRGFLKTVSASGASAALVGPSILWSSYALASDASNMLSISRDEETTTLDPILTAQNANIWVLDNMNANLVRVTHDGTGLEPDLAESWKVDNDGKRYVFKLRSGLKFGDGSSLKVSDVKFSLERLRDNKQSVMSSMYQAIKTVNTPDERHVEVILKHVSAPFLSTMAMFAASIVPADVVKARGDKFSVNPVGAGAFKLEKWQRSDRLILVRNKHYWENQKVKLDQVDWIYTPKANTRLLGLRSKQFKAALSVPWNKVSQLKNDSGITMDLDKSTKEDFIIINHSRSPLNDVKVRRALFHALNRDAILKVALYGQGSVSNSFIPAGAPYYNPDNKAYDYDPGKARKLLKEAGVSNNLTLKLLISSGSNLSNQVAVLLQNQYRQVGIKINVVKEEAAQHWSSIQAGNFDLSYNLWVNDIIDPDEKASFALYGYNSNQAYFTRYKNPKMKSLVEEGRNTLDKSKRKKIYDEMQKLAMEDVVYINLFYVPFANASLSEVHNFYQNPTGRLMLEDTSVKGHG